MTQHLTLHCVRCGQTLSVGAILWISDSPEHQGRRSAFERQHETSCGPKSIGLIVELPEPATS